MKGFIKGDPRASAAGRKGGSVRRRFVKRSDDYIRGYRSGWKAGRREAREWIKARMVEQGWKPWENVS